MHEVHANDVLQAYAAEARRANRRRLLVFAAVFLAAALIGLAWNFLRPAEYRATARLEITPPSFALPQAAGESAPFDVKQQFAAEVQTLTSRPLIEAAAARLRAAGHDLDALGADPVLALQSALTVATAEGSLVVELAAVGQRLQLTAALLASLIEAYREHVRRAYQDNTVEASARVDEEVARLEAAVATKRAAVEEFRVRHQIVSPEREENSILAEMQGLAAAQKDANKKLLEAEGKLQALRAADAAGKGVVRARDNPTLVTLEARASQLREELRELGRRYTPEYLEVEPQARALRARLAELEEQIRAQRTVSQKFALEEAEQELAAARESAQRLQQQIAASKQQVGAFAARFAQYRSLQQELTELEKTYQQALQRQARLGATERARMPVVQVLEPAVAPAEPWRPHYWRDAAIVVAVALLLALAAMGLVELFNRPAPRPSVLVAQPVFAGNLLPGQRMPGLEPPPAAPSLGQTERQALAAPTVLPRELTAREVADLLRGATGAVRAAAVLLLSGLSPAEALALRWRDVDAEGIEVAGPPPRRIAVPAETIALLGERGQPDAPVVAADGAPPSAQGLAAQLLAAAHDAAIERPHEVSPEALRHTYLAFLVRQGARFADITRWVGELDAAQLAAYSAMAPAGERIEASRVQRTYPALLEANAA